MLWTACQEKGALAPAMCKALWVGDTIYSEAFFLEDFLGSALGHVLGIQRKIKPVPATSVLGCFGGCQEITQQSHPSEQCQTEGCSGGLQRGRRDLTQCAGQEGRFWSRLPWIQIPALHLLCALGQLSWPFCASVFSSVKWGPYEIIIESYV